MAPGLMKPETAARYCDMSRAEFLRAVASEGRPRQPYTIRGEINAWLAKQGAKGLHPHGLRKNGLLALFEAGCTVPETASISGQSLTMVEHYWNRWNAGKLADNAMKRWDAMK